MADGKGITRANAVRLNYLVQKFADQAEGDAELSEATKRAADLDSVEEGLDLLKKSPEELAAKGWTKKDLRVAVDAKVPKNQAPFYLHAAHERHTNRVRARENTNPQGGKDAASVIVIPVAPQLPAVEPDEDDEP